MRCVHSKYIDQALVRNTHCTEDHNHHAVQHIRIHYILGDKRTDYENLDMQNSYRQYTRHQMDLYRLGNPMSNLLRM